MSKTDASALVTVLRNVFVEFGDPKTIVTDNGPPFNSAEFAQFCESSDITLLHSPPYHPASNGSAERWVQTVKNSMKKNMGTSFSREKLQEILLTLRNTPTTSSGIIPSHLVFSFKPRTRLEKILCDLNETIVAPEVKHMPTSRSFEIGDLVMLKAQGDTRLKCRISAKLGRALYEVDLGNVQRTAHANQLVRIGSGVEIAESNSACTGDSGNDANEQPETQARPKRNRRPPDRFAY